MAFIIVFYFGNILRKWRMIPYLCQLNSNSTNISLIHKICESSTQSYFLGKPLTSIIFSHWCIFLLLFTDLQLLALVSILASALMIVLSHMFYLCGYIPKAKRCKICSLGGLPAVLVTSGNITLRIYYSPCFCT